MKNLVNVNPFLKPVFSDLDFKIKELFGNNLISIVLYGSYARCEETSDSDIDIMIIVDMLPQELKKFRDAIVDIEVDLNLKYDVVLSITVENTLQFNKYSSFLPYFKNILNEGVLIHG